jgi:hypothetical protein
MINVTTTASDQIYFCIVLVVRQIMSSELGHSKGDLRRTKDAKL